MTVTTVRATIIARGKLRSGSFTSSVTLISVVPEADERVEREHRSLQEQHGAKISRQSSRVGGTSK